MRDFHTFKKFFKRKFKKISSFIIKIYFYSLLATNIEKNTERHRDIFQIFMKNRSNIEI